MANRRRLHTPVVRPGVQSGVMLLWQLFVVVYIYICTTHIYIYILLLLLLLHLLLNLLLKLLLLLLHRQHKFKQVFVDTS